MKRKIAKLEPEKRECLSIPSSFSRGWEIVNPTNTLLRFVGRKGEGALIRPRPSASLNRKKLYFYLSYNGGASANATYPQGFEDFLVDSRAEQRIVLSTSLDEVMDAPNGLYIEELDIVIGTSDAVLKYPSLEMPDLQIHNDETVIYQFFISAKEPAHKVVYTEVNGVYSRVQVIDTGRAPGLYTMVSDMEGISLKLLNPSPVYAPSEKELITIVQKEKEKRKPVTHESIDVTKFNHFISNISKQSNAETARVDSVLDEEFKVRDYYRKDRLDETKTDRAVYAESMKQTNEAVKAAQAAAGVVSKALGA